MLEGWPIKEKTRPSYDGFYFSGRIDFMIKNYSSFSKKEIINAFMRLQLRLWLVILLGLVGFAYIIYGVYTIVNNDYEFIFLFGGIGFISVSIALGIIPYIIAYKANKNATDIDYELTFYDTYFDVAIKKGVDRQESSIEYKDIFKKIKKGNIFYIYLNQNQAILVKLDGFNEEEKAKFLELMGGK